MFYNIFLIFLYIFLFFTLLFCCSLFFYRIFSSSFSLIYFSFFNIYFHFYCAFLLPCDFSLFILFYFIIFKNHFYWFVLFPCFILQLAHCFGFVFRLSVFASFNPNCLISFLGSFLCLVVLLLFTLFGSVVVSFVCVCFLVSVSFVWFYFLPFVWGFVSLFFFLILFFAGMSDLRGPGHSTRSWTWGSEVGAPSPGCWTTREFPVPGKINHRELSWRSLSDSKTWLHPTASRSQCWMPHTKQQTRQEHKPTHHHTDYLMSY